MANYRLTVWNCGSWNKGYSCLHILKDDVIVWASPSFPQNIAVEDFEDIKSQLEFACLKLGLCLHDEEPSIYEWKVSPLMRFENVKNEDLQPMRTFKK